MIENKNNNIERLPDSELCVMQIIWNNEEPMGTGKIVELLQKEKEWSRSTIQVLLTRLEERGFLTCEKRKRLKYYWTNIKAETYCSQETKTFIENFYNNSYKKLIASLVQDNEMNEEDMEEIIAIIKRGGEG